MMFGSYSKGNANPDIDIDVAVIVIVPGLHRSCYQLGPGRESLLSDALAQDENVGRRPQTHAEVFLLFCSPVMQYGVIITCCDAFFRMRCRTE